MKYPPELEQAIPGLREARQDEQSNRALAFSGLTHTILGIEVCPLTPYHRLSLQLLNNAYASCRSDRATPEDSFQILWILSPKYAVRHELKWWQLRRERIALARAVGSTNRDQMRASIMSYIAMQLQDILEESDGNRPDFTQSVHWMAAEATFWMNVHGGFTFESYQRTPYLVLQQLHRAWRCNHPKHVRNADGSYEAEPPTFINQSDRIAGLFYRAQASRISEIMRANNVRLP
jgi:hypothetical protein